MILILDFLKMVWQEQKKGSPKIPKSASIAIYDRIVKKKKKHLENKSKKL